MRQKRITTRNDYFRRKVRQGLVDFGDSIRFFFVPLLRSLLEPYLVLEFPVYTSKPLPMMMIITDRSNYLVIQGYVT